MAVNNSRLRVTTQSLFIASVKPTDAGEYMCTHYDTTPINETNNSISATLRLTVYSSTAHLTIVAIGNDYISVTWVGIEPTVASGSAQYAIVYRPMAGDAANRDSQLEHELGFEQDNEDYRDDVDEDINIDDDSEIGQKIRQLRKRVTPKGSWNASWCADLPIVSSECLRGTDSRNPTTNIRKLYRKATDVRPYMRGFWVGGLASGTYYEFCVGILRQYELDVPGSNGIGASFVQLINCSVVVTTSTRSVNHRRVGDHTSDNEVGDSDMIIIFVTGGFFVIVCLFPGLVGLLSAAVRRRQRRNEYVEHLDVDLEETYTHCNVDCEPEFRIVGGGPDSTGVLLGADSMSSIPLDNLYQLTSMHSATSRTSLIS